MIAALINLVAFAGITVVVGAVVTRFVVLARSGLSATEQGPASRHAARGALVGALAVLLSAIARTFLMAIELVGPGEPWLPMLRIVVTSTATGQALALQAIWAAAAALAFSSARADRERGWRAAGVAAAVLALTPGMLGHHAAAEKPTVGLIAAAIHVMAAGAWVGGLFHLWRASRVASEATLLRMLGAFHLVAMAAVTLLVLTGLGHALSLLGDLGNLTTTRWGRLLTVKLAFVAATLALGFRHWRGAEARIRAGERGAATASFARELVVAAAVLTVTGLLTVTSPPD